MKALVFDQKPQVAEIATPERKAGESLVRVTLAGICNTDLEIIKGYIPGFRGVLGHEFIGIVEDSDTSALIGKRVAGEINMGCGLCEYCRSRMERHCPNRSVLGIFNKDGAFAEYVVLPDKNLVKIPSQIPDCRAIFIEPLAAALEILDQVEIGKDKSVLLIGDGKLALLIAHVLRAHGYGLIVVGKHDRKLALMREAGAETATIDRFQKSAYDVVIEASGNPGGFELGLQCVKPRGTVVLKSTYAEPFMFNPFPIVVNEITVVGSRCGRFEAAVDFLVRHEPELEKYITAEYGLKDALEALEAARGSLKITLRPI